MRPPKKSWKQITNLSGGEKTLSSLALVFALHYYRPTPLYVMDEIDAALDFRNVSIIGHYIKVTVQMKPIVLLLKKFICINIWNILLKKTIFVIVYFTICVFPYP